MRVRLSILLPALLIGLNPVASRAQVPPDSTISDSTRIAVPPDSTAGDSAQTTPARPPAFPINPIIHEPGIRVDTLNPVQTRFSDLPHYLSEQLGSFLYTLGVPDWPHGWSPYGLNPRYASLTLNGLPMDDLVDGRPRFDLLPFEALEPIRQEPTHHGRPVALHTTLRPYREQEPLTELRYHSGQNGLQFISGLHVQQRQPNWFGKPGRLNVLFRYGGRGSTGEYSNSKIRLRQVLGRIRYEQADRLIELSNNITTREQGAHGGVQVSGTNFDSIYNRFLASVRLPNAQRITKRNDLWLTLKMRLIRTLEPFTARTYWTSQISRFVDSDTLDTRVYRYGFQFEQPLPEWVPRHQLTFRVDGWTDRLQQSRVWPDSLIAPRNQWHWTLRDEARVFGSKLTTEIGLHRVGGAGFSSFQFRLDTGSDARGLFLEGMSAGIAPSWIEQYGFGGFIESDTGLAVGRVLQARFGIHTQLDPFGFQAFTYLNESRRAIELFEAAGTDTLAVVQSGTPYRWMGVGGTLGWRHAAQRGFYATARANLFALLNADAASDFVRAEAGLPRFTGDLRVGMRYLLFNDLDLDLSVRGRYWTAFRSRIFHPQTALFALPLSSARTYGPSGTLDVYLEGTIRGATIFVSLENILAGRVYAGTLIVPVYPLPEQFFRLGVYWPISG